jgi:hypothetical protein
MQASSAVPAFLTPSGCLTISKEDLEDQAAEALLPAPADPSDLLRPVLSRLPVRVIVERLAE